MLGRGLTAVEHKVEEIVCDGVLLGNGNYLSKCLKDKNS